MPSVAGERREPGKTTDSFILYFAGRPIALLDRLTAVDPDSGSTASRRLLYLTTDHLGTPDLATDESGSTVWSGGFEPFGVDYAGAQDNGVFLRFPGQWEDSLGRAE